MTCEDGYVKFVNENENPVRIKDEISQGAVIMCMNGTFHSICDVGWDNQDASVLCSEMGFSRYGKLISMCDNAQKQISYILYT